MEEEVNVGEMLEEKVCQGCQEDCSDCPGDALLDDMSDTIIGALTETCEEMVNQVLEED